MKLLVELLTCEGSRHMSHSIGIHKLEQENKPTELSFSLQMDNEARYFKSFFLLHALSFVALLLEYIEHWNLQGFWRVATALRSTS